MRRRPVARPFFRVRTADEGFTLIEITWALVLLGIVAMGSLGLFIRGTQSTAQLQRQQAAVMLANSAMDTARSVTGGPVYTGAASLGQRSGLVQGRSQSDVMAVWDDATAIEPADTADMSPVWDVLPGVDEADQWVPIRDTAVVDNQTYTIDTLVGACYRPRTASTEAQDCVAVNPDPHGDDYLELLRARVVVRWNEGSGERAYRVSTLIDPSQDPIWNTALITFAYDDEYTIPAGDPWFFMPVLVNDTVEYVSNPIRNLTAPSYGSVVSTTLSEVHGVRYTLPPGVSGTVTFNYQLQGSAGSISAPALVTVNIVPEPVNDTIYVTPGSFTDLTDQLLDNDHGVTNVDLDRTTTIVAARDEDVDLFSTSEVSDEVFADRDASAQYLVDNGISIDGNGRLWFDAPDAEDLDGIVFYYYLVDEPIAGGLDRHHLEQPARVRVIVEEPSVFVEDFEVTLEAPRSGTSWQSINWLGPTGNSSDSTIEVINVSNSGQTRLRNINDLQFRTEPSTRGEFQIEYHVADADGRESSDTGVITVTVTANSATPEARPLDVTLQRGQTHQVQLVQLLGYATNNVRIAEVTRVTCGSGTGNRAGSASVNQQGTRVDITLGSNLSASLCTFTYTLRTASTPYLYSETETLTVVVRR